MKFINKGLYFFLLFVFIIGFLFLAPTISFADEQDGTQNGTGTLPPEVPPGDDDDEPPEDGEPPEDDKPPDDDGDGDENPGPSDEEKADDEKETAEDEA